LNQEIENANNTINEQKTIISQQETKILEMSEDIKNKTIIIEEQTTLFEALEMELKESKGSETISSETSDRLKCSKCGSVGKDIKIVEDKTKILSYVGNMPMYAKVHICKKCGNSF
jgi:ribosomal protein S27AE